MRELFEILFFVGGTIVFWSEILGVLLGLGGLTYLFWRLERKKKALLSAATTERS